MAEDRTKRAPLTSKPISLTENYEIEYWRSRFGVSDERLAEAVSDERLAEAVRRVGLSAAAVEAHLKK
jgi:uncharacterized protein DUF3606